MNRRPDSGDGDDPKARTRWALQVRAPITLANGREGNDFVIATATLNRDDLLALRGAIDASLAEAEDLKASAAPGAGEGEA